MSIITIKNKIKPIDLILEYQNRVYTNNIKNNKVLIYNFEFTLIQFTLNFNILIIIKRGVKRIQGKLAKGIYTANNPFTNIISYTFKLYNNNITMKKLTPFISIPNAVFTDIFN